MGSEFAKLLGNTLPGELSVFAGSLPLLGVIDWFAFQQGDRFRRIEQSIDKVGRLGVETGRDGFSAGGRGQGD